MKIVRMETAEEIIDRIYASKGIDASADELIGDELKHYMCGMRKANDDRLAAARANIDTKNIRFDELEEMYTEHLSVGAADATNNSKGRVHDVTEMLEVLVGQMDRWNRKARMANNMVDEQEGLGVPPGACYGRYLSTIKTSLQLRIGQSLARLETSLVEDEACEHGDIAELRRMAVALKDMNSLQAHMEAQEDTESGQ
ncbi:hypothetical protein LTR65_007062 [Meristemomyces frigidus]